MYVIKREGSRPIKAWVGCSVVVSAQFPNGRPDIEGAALEQAENLAKLPFIASNGVALMPDVHAGIGSTVGTVIATDRVVIPAAVGVDIGCGMNALRLSLKASDLPESLKDIRHQIERDIPLGAGGAHRYDSTDEAPVPDDLRKEFYRKVDPYFQDAPHLYKKAWSQLGTLGSGNHFIELCLDENQNVWVMLHSGSRGIGNMIGSHFIEKAKREMERWHIHLPDKNLAYLPEGSEHFDGYMNAVLWAQRYAMQNREVMMNIVLAALKRHIKMDFEITQEAINCHHNYVEKENHFGKNLWITRKGAIRARVGDLGIIPGSMGQRSYIVRGKGNAESYCSCSHGAGRVMSRTEARKRFTVDDLKRQTEGVECPKTEAVLDEIPTAYKDLDVVMANQTDLIEVVHTLKAIMNVKGA